MKSHSLRTVALTLALMLVVVVGVIGVLSLGLQVAAPLAIALLSLVLFAVPIHVMPALILVLFALLPLGYIGDVPSAAGRYITPAALAVAVMLLRSIRTTHTVKLPRVWTGSAITLILWSVATFTWSLDMQRSALWTASFALVVFGYAYLATRATPESVSALRRTWLWLGVLLGGMAVAEGLLQRSFLESLYARGASSGIGFSQHWDSVRATTTLGHPLMNGTFFAATAAYGFLFAMRRGSKLGFACGVLASSGAIFSVSRSAAAGVAVGLIVGLLVSMLSRQLAFGRKAFGIILVVGGASAVLFSPIIQGRSDSAEGAGSAQVRDVILERALQFAADSNYLGDGAGMAQERAIRSGLNLPIENSYAAVLVSLGWPGALLLITLFAVILLTAAQRHRPEVAASAAAFGTAIWAWPLVDNYPGALILMGLFAYLAFAGSDSDEPEAMPQVTSQALVQNALR